MTSGRGSNRAGELVLKVLGEHGALLLLPPNSNQHSKYTFGGMSSAPPEPLLKQARACLSQL